jgi:hypothetical protein
MAKEYNISKAQGQCLSCEKQLEPGDLFTAVVRETMEDFAREDYCLTCWEKKQEEISPEDKTILGLWQTRVPQPQEKKKLFVDDELIIHFFERLETAEEEIKIAFRYVLALVLMRKRLLIYDRMERLEDGQEVWFMHFRKSDQEHRVIDPKLDEGKIAEVSEQLGQILEGEL